MKDEFYITLPSNTHKDSKTGNFSVYLPRTIQLDGNGWEVALAEIQYPKTWINFPTRVEKETGQLTTSIFVSFEDNTGTIINIVPGNFEKIYQLLNAIDLAIEETRNQSKLVNVPKSQETSKKIDLTENLSNQAETVSEPLPWTERFKALRTLRFKFDSDLNKTSVHFDDKIIKQLEISTHLQYLLGFEDRFLNRNGEQAMYSPDLKGGIDALYVYCSLCEPQIVGNSMVKLLRIVHVQGDYGTTIEKIFYAPHYVPVIVRNFEHIDIEIKSDTNVLIPFESGKTVVKLHFRKRRLVF
jgi:hypothetical protein